MSMCAPHQKVTEFSHNVTTEMASERDFVAARFSLFLVHEFLFAERCSWQPPFDTDIKFILDFLNFINIERTTDRPMMMMDLVGVRIILPASSSTENSIDPIHGHSWRSTSDDARVDNGHILIVFDVLCVRPFNTCK